MPTTTERRRRQLVQRDGSTCRYCAHPLADPFTMDGVIVDVSHDDEGQPYEVYRAAPGYRWPQLDHVVPRCRGGSNNLTNLVLACGPCNVAKGSRPVEDFLAARP